ncbi:hypothetical protein ACOTET_01545 [Achromobacter xylosoxidans]|uniref:hypothetical protein n=1 Tax=Achromobacter ruhlandii TaxID=72557 RepID=UPI003BA1001C
MKQSDLNHLRRLLGWVRCDIGQDPAGQQQTMIDIAGKLPIDSIDADAKARLVEGYRRAEAVPVYVRDAVKALEKALAAVGRAPGVVAPRATAETRANAGFTLGVEACRETMLTDEQIRTLILEKIGNVTQALREDAMEFARAIETAVRSKPRAPVSDIRESFELTYAADADDPACASDLSHFTNGWQACIWSHVRAPAADLRPHLEWALRRIGSSLDTGDKYEAAQAALDAAKAAPQASALAEEYTRGRADGFDAGYSAALEKAAALVGGHTWAGASQIVSDLIAEHIRALKAQADKDGGQQRAGDEQPDFMQPRMTPWGRLVRACRIILGTTLMDMSKALGMPPSDLSAYECDHQRLTDDVILAVMRFFDERGLCIPATAWRKAARASARTALSGTQAGQGERQ